MGTLPRTVQLAVRPHSQNPNQHTNTTLNMDKANLRLSGKLEANGNGTIANQSFKLTATAGFANGGAVTLTANPGFSPAYENKAANFTGDDVKAIADIAKLQNIDLKFAKGGIDLAGQTCDVTVARDSSGASGVEIKSNVDKVGDVTVSLVQEGHKTLNNEDKDDITVRLRTNVDSDKKAKTTINLDYSGIEGIGVGVEVKDDKTGSLSVTKDDFKLKVPVKDNKPNAEEASITYNWGIDM